jgi:hypothetical protein
MFVGGYSESDKRSAMSIMKEGINQEEIKLDQSLQCVIG